MEIEEVLSVHLYSTAPGLVDQAALQETARVLRNRLLANPVIEEVITNGRQTPELSIQVDEQLLQSLGLSLSDIADRVSQSSLIEPGGELFSADGTMILKADQPHLLLK